MIKCAFCQAELPDHASFCLSCGKAIETEADLVAPSSIDRKWLMDVFTSDGYECELPQDSGNTDRNGFFAKRNDDRLYLFVSLRPSLGLFSLDSIFKLKRARHDELPLRTAIDEFNRQILIWSAYMLDKDTLALKTIFTLSARTSPRSIKVFLASSNEGVFGFLQSSGLAQRLV